MWADASARGMPRYKFRITLFVNETAGPGQKANQFIGFLVKYHCFW